VLGLGGSEQRYRVESYAVEPLPGNPVTDRNITDVHVVGETIARAVKKSGTRVKTAACAVSGAAVITKVISMPSALSEDELETQIRLEADQYIPYPLEEVKLDFEVLGPSEREPDRVDVLLAASRNDNVEVLVAALETGGLKGRRCRGLRTGERRRLHVAARGRPRARGYRRGRRHRRHHH
jgi:type IV pilus assembly protein PilM